MGKRSIEIYKLKVFSGPVPCTKEDEDCGLLLIEMSIEEGFDGRNLEAKGVAIEDGIAGYYRVYNRCGDVFLQEGISDIKSGNLLAIRNIAKGQTLYFNKTNGI